MQTAREPLRSTASQPNPGVTLSKAVTRAAQNLKISQAALAKILGLSQTSVSRLVSGSYVLSPERPKEWEFGVLFVRAFRSLDAIVGNITSAQEWLRSANTGLNGRPVDLMETAEGLVRVLNYLDAHRGRI